MNSSLFETLNSAQQEAVTHGDGPCLVIAGAGTGKTCVITERIAHLVKEKNVAPESIVALTFTDKAAGEMQERLDELLDYGTFVTTSTFHSFCNELIRRHAFRIGINPEARLITEADQVAILREYIDQLPLSHYRPSYNPNPLLKQIAHYIEQAKEAQLSPEKLIEHAKGKLEAASDDAESEAAAEYLELAFCYQSAIKLYKELNVLTYADLLCYAHQILEESPVVRKEEQERFQYLLIDEFQDTNTIQAEIAYLIAGKRANLFVVGDDDQAIYRFRGANVKNILDFKDRFPKAKIVTLTENYRSTQPILDAAYRLIQHNNPHRLESHLNIRKQLQAQDTDTTEPCYLHYSSGTHEAEGVASTIKELIATGQYEPQDIAVIARSHNQLDPFEEELQALEVPVNRVKEGNFFQEPSVVQALSYLRFLSAPHNSENLFRLLCGTPFNVAGEELVPYNVQAKRRHLSLWDALHAKDITLSDDLSAAIRYCENALKTQATLAPSRALRQHVYDSKWQVLLVESAEERAAIHLNSLYNQARTFELLHQPTTILSFVDHCDRLIASGEDVTVESELNQPREGVTLITAHSSKGLEYPVVFVVNLVMRRFPMQINSNDLQLPTELITPLKDNILYEEERRLAYVAFTRAKKRLYLSNADRYGTNKNPSKPSPFIVEALELSGTPECADQPLRGTILSVVIDNGQQALVFPRQFTASALEAFEDNPALFYRDYVLQIMHSEQDMISINFGNAVHNTLRDIFNARREQVELDLEETFARYWVGEGYASAAIRDREMGEGISMIKRHLEKLPEKFYPHLIEESLVLQLKEGYKIVGKVDRIDQEQEGHFCIVDYKTGNLDAKEADVKKNLPLGLYAAAFIQHHKNVKQLDVSLNYLRTGSEPRLKVTTDFVTEQIEKAREIIKKMESAYAAREFPDTSKYFGLSRVR